MAGEWFYYIQSSEIQENIVDIYCIFYIFTSENIKSYIFTSQECTYKYIGLPRVATVREKCLENDFFSRSGKSQGISIVVREI